ncbi:hypothetical protein [Nostoc sp.]|uniref:hypothetical protein n=1 Tax=Nostoc sp. TaxID=1180 RepID=UPI002FFD2FB6
MVGHSWLGAKIGNIVGVEGFPLTSAATAARTLLKVLSKKVTLAVFLKGVIHAQNHSGGKRQSGLSNPRLKAWD